MSTAKHFEADVDVPLNPRPGGAHLNTHSFIGRFTRATTQYSGPPTRYHYLDDAVGALEKDFFERDHNPEGISKRVVGQWLRAHSRAAAEGKVSGRLGATDWETLGKVTRLM